jgi:homoserine kinase
MHALRAFRNFVNAPTCNFVKRKSMNPIRVRVPATTANLGPGFDALGLALQIYNYVSIEQSPAGADEIAASGEGASTLNATPAESNIACHAARALLDRLDLSQIPIRLTLENAIPLARGLGSSSAARVGALVATNEWARRNFGKSVDRSTLLALAARLEGHPDNVAPALLGGFVVSATGSSRQSDESDRNQSEVLALRVAAQEFPRLVVFIPESELETKEARAVLPDAVFREDAVFNIARASLLTGVLASGAWREASELLREALRDKLHQEHRAALMPAYECTVHAALRAGALGATLSGAGPTILAWLPADEKIASAEVAGAMQEAAAGCEVFGNAREVLVDGEGCAIVGG